MDTSSEIEGFIACGVAVLLFGSNLVPIKKFETGDGLFFQWIACSSIMFVAIIIQLIVASTKFYPLAMVGGVLWCTGNVMTVPIVKLIGLGQGILLWGSINLLLGWASGRFGWFGIHPQVPNNPVLNYVGMCLCLSSTFVYLLIRSNSSSAANIEHRPLLVENFSDNANTNNVTVNDVTAPVTSEEFLPNLSPRLRRILGIGMALSAGCFYGLQFVPIMYLQDNSDDKNGWDYVFSMYTGIYATSTVYFLIYCVFKVNQPQVFPRIILPAFVSGGMWAIATSAWLVANKNLSAPISFPIITTAPGMIGALWGVFFKEIRGRRNYIVLTVAFSLSITGAILTGLSKK